MITALTRHKRTLALVAVVLAVGLAFAMLSDAAPGDVTTEAQMPHSKMLVLYYSRSGTTAKLGQQIAKATGADAEALVDTVNRQGPWGFLRSLVDAGRRNTTTLAPLHFDPAQYDLVILGTPDWGKSISSPMRTFLGAYKGKLKRVAFFLTDGHSDHAAIFKEMAERSGRQPVATLGVAHDDVWNDKFAEPLAKFLAALPVAAPVPQPEQAIPAM